MKTSSVSRLGCAVFAWAMLSCPASSYAGVGPSNAACETRTNDSAAKLVACIQRQALWQHLVAFQRIADSNPGANGHGNRNTGEPGYKASVDYVAALVRAAGYRVTIQPYAFTRFRVTGVPTFGTLGHNYAVSQDWYVARLSGHGTLTAPVQPVGGIVIAAAGGSGSGCSPSDFAGFVPGSVALIQRAWCAFDTQVKNAEAARAAGVVIFNSVGAPDQFASGGKGTRGQGEAFQAYLTSAASIPVVGVASFAVGAGLYHQCIAGRAPVVRLDIQTQLDPEEVDYNLIADSRFGDPNHVVVVDAHLDSIYGAGMLDNASGSATILEVALKMAKTRTRNQLRFIWFGGEELGLLGSAHYTKTLTQKELRRIVFDLDSDVTATPNYDILVADPEFAHNVKRFPPNVVPASQLGNGYFAHYFTSVGLVSHPASFGNDGTDSNSFSLVGVPNTGILTQQDCCKSQAEVNVWGGFRGNYEGNIPSFDGGCVDRPHRWCDDLDNNEPRVLEFISKAVAHVTFDLANHAFL